MLSAAPREIHPGWRAWSLAEHGGFQKNEVTHAWDLKFISNPKSQNQMPLNLPVNEVVLSAFLDQNVFLLKYD